jgi:hypothetical protein
VISRTFRHGVKSYDVIEYVFNILFPARRGLVVVDLTYGRGRFYRKVRSRIGTLVAVDIYRHDWEVEPDVFYQMTCQEFTSRVIRGEIELPRADLVVVDPPWDTLRRGLSGVPGLARMPYHMYARPLNIIHAGMALAKHMNTLLVYRYKELLRCNHIITVRAEVKVFERRGWVYYGVCKAF